MNITMFPADWLSFFVHFMLLSLLAVGGAITTVPDMHRYLVDERGWLTDAQFFQFGWRVPFLASAALVLLGLYVRLRITETPVFRQARPVGVSLFVISSGVPSKST